MEEPQPKIKKPKGKRSLKKTDKRQDKNPYAYTITDKFFGELKVKKSFNAWWLDRRKVENLIEVYKLDPSLEEALFYAGISKGQYDYFVEQHPEFSAIKEVLRQNPILVARQTINKALATDLGNAWKYLSRKRKAEFGPNLDLTSGGEKIPGDNSIKFVNFSKANDENDDQDLNEDNDDNAIS